MSLSLATSRLPSGVLYTFRPATPAASAWSYPILPALYRTKRAFRSAGSWAMRNRGEILTGVAVGVCFGSGGLGCGAALAVAWGAKSSQRIERYGFRRSLGANIADGVLTAGTLGLVRAPGQYLPKWAAQQRGPVPIRPPRALSRKERYFVSGMSRGAVGGSNFVSCRIGRRCGSGSYC